MPTATPRDLKFRHLAEMEKRGDIIIGQRVKEARDRLRLTQERLAEQMSEKLAGRRKPIGRSTIAGIESAQRSVSRKMLADLADFFGVPVDYFTSRDHLMAEAMWVLGRLPREELEAWVTIMQARASSARLAGRD